MYVAVFILLFIVNLCALFVVVVFKFG